RFKPKSKPDLLLPINRGVINVSHFPIFCIVTRKSVSTAESKSSIPVIRASSYSSSGTPPGSSTTAVTTTGGEKESIAGTEAVCRQAE
ncbi:hypothetical protein LINPERHAP2_LOCUS21932, partial [Linum perenne]